MSHKTAKLARRRSKEQVDEFLLKALRGLRKMCGEDLNQLKHKFPDHKLPCSTCAFRAFTDKWDGMDRTVMLLLAALLSDSPFYCHVDPTTNKPFPNNSRGEYGLAEALERGDDVSLCAAWSAICMRPKGEIIGCIADAILGEPCPRPVPLELADHIVGLVDIARRAERE